MRLQGRKEVVPNDKAYLPFPLPVLPSPPFLFFLITNMSIIELTSDLLTGVEEMDKEHKVLVDMLNSIAELLKDGKRQEAEKVFVN